MAKGWVNPKRQRMDRYLESKGLLNYQTQGLSQAEIAQRYAQAGVKISTDTNWWKQNYQDRPADVTLQPSNQTPTPKGWGITGGGTNLGIQSAKLNGEYAGQSLPPITPAQPRITAPVNNVPAVGEMTTINGKPVKVTYEIQKQLTAQSLNNPGLTPNAPINPNAQTDWKAQDFQWEQLSEAQKAQVINNPNFHMSDVKALGQQGLILSDSQFKLFNQTEGSNGAQRAPAYGGQYKTGINPEGTGYGPDGKLQWWQPVAYTLLSNPKTQPVAQAAAMTLLTGGAATPTALGILGLGYLSQLKDNSNPLLAGIGSLSEKGMYALNWGAQTVEQIGGTVSYLTNGGSDNGAAGVGATVANVITGRDQVVLDRVSNFISEPKLRDAVWNASKIYYETQGKRLGLLSKALNAVIPDPQERQDTARAINAILPLVRDENTVWVLGEAEPVPVQPGYTLDDAVQKILDGASSEEVMAEYQQAYGLSGVASDFMLQAVFDPLNVADSAVSEVKAKVMDARSARLIETGVMTPEQAARVEVNNIKADVYRETPSVNLLTEALPWSETTRKLRAGLQEAARGNAEVAKVLTPWERRLAGLTPDGKIKELLPVEAKAGIPKFIQYVFSLKPDAKARLFLDRGTAVLQSLFDYSTSAELAPRQMVDILKATAKADMPTLKEAGAEFMGAPEAYTIIGAARDFIPEIEKRAIAFENTAEQRTRVTAVLEALDGDRTVLKNGLSKADWEKLKAVDSPLSDAIKKGEVTFDTLKKDVEIFRYKKDGTTKADLSVQEFKARVAAAFDDHVLNWGKDYFGIEKVGQFEEGLRALKGLQSLMLLDISPTSIMNDIINERVMIATRGTLGLTDSAVIGKFMDDMGVTNTTAQSVGGMGDSAKAIADPINSLTRSEGGIFTRAADAIQKVRSKLPRSNVTAITNEAHQLQIRYAEMKRYMTRNWAEGKGFDRMPPSLEAKLKEYGYEPGLVYQNLRSTFKAEQIDLLKDRATSMDVNTFVDQAAQMLGKDAQEARATLEQLGALDQLKEGLQKAQTLEQRAQVFDRVSESVVNSIDIRLAQQLKGMLENVRNKIKAEGAAGVIQIFQEIPLDYFERKIENDNIWDDAFAKAAEVEDYTVKNAIKSKAARDNQAAWRRTQARQAALYIAALEGLDLSREFGRDFMLNLADEQKILQKFFDDKNAKAQSLSSKPFKNAEQATGAWDGFFSQFNDRFAKDQARVIELQKKRNILFAQEMGRLYGQNAEAMATNWMDAVMSNTETMHKTIVEFRKGLEGLPAEERARQWKEFKPQYQSQWRERMAADMNGAGNLYKWDENPQYVADYIDRANADMQAKLQADAERRTALLQIADEFGFKQDTRDMGKLQFGTLRKPEYGGIPDLKGLNDPRLTPELMREILTKRAEVKAAEAALQPELPTQPIVTTEAQPVNRIVGYKIGDNTKLNAALKEMGGISTSLARELIGDDNVRRAGNVFKLNGRTDIDVMVRELADYGYPIDFTRIDDPDGIAQFRDLLQRQLTGNDVYPVTRNIDRQLEREARAYYEEQRAQEIYRYTSEADAIRAELDGFDHATPDAAQKASDLYNRAVALFDAPESLFDTPHNGVTLLDTIIEINARANELTAQTEKFDQLLDATFRAREDMRTMETHGDGLTKREEIHRQLKDTFGPDQGEAISQLVDLRAQRWADMTGRTPEEWYASRVESVNKEGGNFDLAQFYQQAFHGSPYRFDKFTLDKIGSGEGAQAYGWGLYFAGDQSVAEFYNRNLSKQQVIYEGKKIGTIDREYGSRSEKAREDVINKMGYTDRRDVSDVNSLLLQYLYRNGDWQRVKAEWLPEINDYFKPNYERLISELENKVTTKTKGQTYKVEIPDEGYLLWDKPLSEQPESVKAALAKFGKTEEAGFGKTTGEVLYKYLTIDNSIDKNYNFKQEQKAASLALKEAGINGIKYLDGSSRGAGEGNYNYVIFDDSAIQILETYYQMNPEGVIAKGGVSFDQFGRATITAMKSADVSTGVHEFAHVFLEDFRRMVDEALPEHAQTIKQDMNTLKVWTGLKQDGNTWHAVNAKEFTITEEGGKFVYRDPSTRKPLTFDTFEEAQNTLEHEMFARGFEKYLYEGKAPTSALARLYERFAGWMREIYHSLTGKAINVEISPAMQDFYNRLLSDYERVSFDTNTMTLYSDGTIRPKAAPFGLERVNKEQSARKADQIANADLLARAQAEQRKSTTPSPIPNNWRNAFNDAPDVYRQAQILRAIADSSRSSAELMDVAKLLPNMPEENNIAWAIINNPASTPEIIKVAKYRPANNRLSYAATGDYVRGYAQTPDRTAVWQFTREEYAALTNADGGFTPGEVEQSHRVAVEQAYRAGKDVPEEVLKEYPYLVNPDAGRYNTPEAIARRDAMRSTEAQAYYENKRKRQDDPAFYQQNGDTMPTLPPGGYDQLSKYMDVSKLLYDGWLDEVKPMMDEMKKAALKPENRYNFAGMDEQTRKELNLYLADTKGKLATAKNAARRWGDEMVDFTLLDYRRQYGFDKLFNAVVPYEFFGVRSAANWFTRVMDRPAYLSHFARIQQLHETYESQLPERTRGKVFLPMPFLPDWAGDGVFVDPKFALFPWTQFTQPLDAIKRQDATLSNNAVYILRDWVDEGTITEQQAQEAINARRGTYWTKAIEQAKVQQGENINSGADYFSMLFGPALYLTVPYYLATGKKPLGINSSYPAGQLPITRFGQAMETAFKDTPMEWIGNAAGLLAKPEEYARKQMGLPQFGEWGDYYIDRQLANMAAEGVASPEAVQMAMIERKGPLYDEATQRVKTEMMLRIPGMAPLYALSHGATFDKVIGSLIPSLFPGGILPPAEMEYKGLKQEYNLTWQQYSDGNKEALTAFFDAHPEYQARLALRRDPEERLQQFLKSQIWDIYGELGPTDRKTAAGQMDGFDQFLGAEPGQEFSTQQLAQWAQQLGALVPKVEQTAPALQTPAPKINYFAPEVTRITDQYFEERKRLFPDYWKQQNEYYQLTSKAEKRQYLFTHPNLKAYFDWKNKWYDAHPDLVPVFNGEVFKNVDTTKYPPMLKQMLQMYALTGESIPNETKPLLEMAWIEQGRPYGDMDTWIEKDLIPSIRNDMAQGMVQ